MRHTLIAWVRIQFPGTALSRVRDGGIQSAKVAIF